MRETFSSLKDNPYSIRKTSLLYAKRLITQFSFLYFHGSNCYKGQTLCLVAPDLEMVRWAELSVPVETAVAVRVTQSLTEPDARLCPCDSYGR